MKHQANGQNTKSNTGSNQMADLPTLAINRLKNILKSPTIVATFIFQHVPSFC